MQFLSNEIVQGFFFFGGVSCLTLATSFIAKHVFVQEYKKAEESFDLEPEFEED